MSADWIALTKEAGLVVENESIRVDFRNERHQLVHVDDRANDFFRLWSVVAKPSIVEELGDALLRGWRRNRLTELVGFRLDGRRRMIGEVCVPTAGLTADEWGFTVRYVAKVCDGFEYVLTGRDVQ